MNKKKLIFIITIVVICVLVVVSTMLSISANSLSTGVKEEVDVIYDIQSDWGNGAAVNITLKNEKSVDTDGWVVEWVFPDNQKITEMWGATYIQEGKNIKATNMIWNSKINSGNAINFGFLLSYSGSNNEPSNFIIKSGNDSSDIGNGIKILDTPEIKAEMQKARDLAGEDLSLLTTQRLQSRDIDENGNPTTAPGVDSNGANTYAKPTKIFDNLYYVGTLDAGSFILTTSEGYIMIDAGYDYSPENFINPGMEELGLDPSKIKYILITHAGPDHVGGAKYYQEKYGTQIVMSEQEWGMNKKPDILSNTSIPETSENTNRTGRMKITLPDQDIIGKDGEVLTLGETSVTIVETPRRVNGGGLSYIATVFDNGEPHMWSTYGNTNVVGTLEDKQVYRESVEHFLTYVDEANVDSVISNHPFVDGSLVLMEKLRNKEEGEENPFIFGEERTKLFFEILDQCAVVLTERQKAGLDETGTKLLN